MNKQFSIRFLVLALLFNLCLIAANLLEMKLITLGPITATGGLLVFPISYIVNDLIAEVWGFRRARLLIWTGFGGYFFMLLMFQLVIQLPAPAEWDMKNHFDAIYNFAPRIAVASLVAFLVGSFINAYVMSKMKLAQKGRNFSLRAVVSTLLGETADSIVFFPIAFGGLIANDELLLLILTQAGMKSLYEVLVLPLTNYIVKRVKQKEQTDVYDQGISYNITKISDY